MTTAGDNGHRPDAVSSTEQHRTWTRRAFLGTAAGGAAAVTTGLADPASATTPATAPARDWSDWWGRAGSANQFGRMFPELPAFAEPSEQLAEALIELSRPGGILDAKDPVEVGPVRLIVEPELSPSNRDNPTQTAGTTFVGQFLDHDITRDAGSPLGRPLALERSRNLRSPRLDLDSVYGNGPSGSPELYEDRRGRNDPVRFRVESGGQFEDLPRRADGSAILADPRNDENLMVSGIQAAFLLFHNAVADRIESQNRWLRGGWAFEQARQQVRWHWQWIVVNEFLPQVVGRDMADRVVDRRRRGWSWGAAQIPVEFQGAAYRFGHSMVRPSYRANLAGDDGKPFFALVFDPDDLAGPDPDTLLGGYRAPRRFIGWQTFFDFGDGEVKPNKRIDTTISTPLFRLPTFTIDRPDGSEVGPTSLATRNLLRHVTWQIPSGQSVAEALGVDRLDRGDLADIGAFGADLDTSTPLWLYVLREAEVMTDGRHLGPVGGHIVAQTIADLLDRDPTSYRRSWWRWRPSLPSAGGRGVFTMADLLRVAGVDPDSRGQ